MTTPVRLRDGYMTREAAGLRVVEQLGRRAIEHNGSNRGFNAQLSWFSDDDLFVIVLCNVREASAITRARKLAAAVFEGPALKSSALPKLSPAATVLLSHHEGVYESEDTVGVLEVEIDGPYGVATLYADHVNESRTGSNVLQATAKAVEFSLTRSPVAMSLTFGHNQAKKRIVTLKCAGKASRVYTRAEVGMPKDMDELTGTYQCRDLGATSRLFLVEGRLEFEILRSGRRRIPRGRPQTVTRDFLVFAGDPVTSLRVIRGPKGRPVALELNEPRIRGIRLRKQS